MTWGSRYDNFWILFSCPCYRRCIFLVMKFSELAPRPSPGPIFSVLLLPCGWEIRICVYHLRSVDSWGKMLLYIINVWSSPGSRGSSVARLGPAAVRPGRGFGGWELLKVQRGVKGGRAPQVYNNAFVPWWPTCIYIYIYICIFIHILHIQMVCPY